MAYNFKNALVNLNEEIRKGGGGGGGQIPALQLAVSQLQISMTQVKASVANVSAEVNAIKQTLANLSPSENEHIVGKWIDGSDLYEKTIVESVNITTNSSYIDTGVPSDSVVKMWIVPGMSYIENSTTVFMPLPYVHSASTSIVGGFLDLSETNARFNIRAGSGATGTQTLALTVRYVKKAQTRKGGKK